MTRKNSIVDDVLQRYGFILKFNPYRIEDTNGSIIQSGPSFDLREETLKSQKEAAKRREENQFKVS